MVVVHPKVVRPVWSAPEGDARHLDAPEYVVEPGFSDPEAIVLHREVPFCFIEVERQPFVDIDGRERPDPRLSPPPA